METAKLRRSPEFKREFFVAGTGGITKRTVFTSVGSEFERSYVRIATFVFVTLSTYSNYELVRIGQLYLQDPKSHV